MLAGSMFLFRYCECVLFVFFAEPQEFHIPSSLLVAPTSYFCVPIYRLAKKRAVRLLFLKQTDFEE